MRICRENKDAVMTDMLNGQLDSVVSSNTHFVDEILLAMHDNGVLGCLTQGISDKRKDNTTVRLDLILALSVAAKMKTHMSLTDIPHAITDHRLLAKLGFNITDLEGEGCMSEGTLRAFIKKYTSHELFEDYNKTTRIIMEQLNISPDIHIRHRSQSEQ